MDELSLVEVPVRLETTASEAYYDQIKASAVDSLDLVGRFKQWAHRPDAWALAQVDELAAIMRNVEERAQLEGGRVALRGAGGIAVVGKPLRTLLLTVSDGRVVGIQGGGCG